MIGRAQRKLQNMDHSCRGWLGELFLLRHFFMLAALCWSAGVGSPALHAQLKPSVTAKIQPEEVRAGGTAAFILTVENGQPQDEPQLKLPEGVESLSDAPSYSTSISIINGVRSQSTEYRWDISSNKNGKHVFPPQEVTIAGTKYASNETRLVVKDNPSTPSSPYDPLLTLEIEKREMYVGESVPITANLYLHEGVLLRRIGLIEVPKDNFAIQRFPQHPDESIVSMGGESYRAFGFHSTLSPLKEGKYKLGPATSEIIIDLPLERGGGRMHGYYALTEPRKTKPQSNDMDITVLPLPTEGKPAHFSGMVGDFQMTATADLHDLTVGDPISVEIAVTGTGNFDSLSPPALSSPQNWKTYPARRTNIPRADSIPEGGLHNATFNQVIIPRQLAETIPPYEFTYFSPTKKKYLTASTQPIAIHMQPAPASAAPKNTVGTPNSVEGSAAEPEKVAPPQIKVTDILTVLPNQVAWTSVHPPLIQDRKFFIWNMAAVGALAAIVLGKLGMVLWQRHLVKAATPLYSLKRELRRSRVTRGHFYQLLAQYIAMRHDATQPLPEPLREALVRNDQINYSPDKERANEPIPRDERAKVLAALPS